MLTDRCNSQPAIACGSERVREKYDRQAARLTVREKGSDGEREKEEGTGTEKVFRVTGYQRKVETGREREREDTVEMTKSSSRDFLPKGAHWQVC